MLRTILLKLRPQLESVTKEPEPYKSLSEACKRTFAEILSKYPHVPSVKCSQIFSLPIDQLAKTLLPSEWKHLTPLQCVGDGNCLYRYAIS